MAAIGRCAEGQSEDQVGAVGSRDEPAIFRPALQEAIRRSADCIHAAHTSPRPGKSNDHLSTDERKQTSGRKCPPSLPANFAPPWSSGKTHSTRYESILYRPVAPAQRWPDHGRSPESSARRTVGVVSGEQCSGRERRITSATRPGKKDAQVALHPSPSNRPART